MTDGKRRPENLLMGHPPTARYLSSPVQGDGLAKNMLGRKILFDCKIILDWIICHLLAAWPIAVIWTIVSAAALSCAAASDKPPVIIPIVDRSVERPPDLFTQGLLFHDGALYESVGVYGKSAVYRWPHPAKTDRLETPELELKLPDNLFAEGLALAQGRLWLLTWREGVVLGIDPANLSVLETIFAPGEGWGLTAIGQNLWRSDGSSSIKSNSGKDFKAEPLEAVTVKDRSSKVENLNELELDPFSGLVLANIWNDDKVAAFNPNTGQVQYYLDLSDIANSERAKSNRPLDAVANGLAFDEEGRLWVTGKLWRRLYRVVYTPPTTAEIGSSTKSAPMPVIASPEPVGKSEALGPKDASELKADSNAANSLHESPKSGGPGN